ncbi:hypothetical protein [Lysobacter sp. Root983]|uniref:hypothetical protein n=1 Tax=Lysobacter sp. Root983 TaxID=1736613 RepID=UPI00070FD8CD|nr:hypothetical protein [Lysobacter sp. Root983]KRD75747.1 hypothetical protein ASE43_12945 [Lysobacter sp. Root983]
MTTAFELHTMGLLLRQGRCLNALSLGLLALTGLWLLLAGFGFGALVGWTAYGLGLSAIAGLLQVYYAARVDFDAGLLLAAARERDPAHAATAVDASLQALGLQPPERAGRDWSARWRGARGLLRRQAACLIAQALLLASAWWLAPLPLDNDPAPEAFDDGPVASLWRPERAPSSIFGVRIDA